jgi:hypothetical protein
MVGVRGFEPLAPASGKRCRQARKRLTHLRYFCRLVITCQIWVALSQALLTMPYRSTEWRSRCGAAAENLAQSASLRACEKTAPSNSGIKHLNQTHRIHAPQATLIRRGSNMPSHRDGSRFLGPLSSRTRKLGAGDIAQLNVSLCGRGSYVENGPEPRICQPGDSTIVWHLTGTTPCEPDFRGVKNRIRMVSVGSSSACSVSAGRTTTCAQIQDRPGWRGRYMTRLLSRPRLRRTAATSPAWP